MHFNSQYYFSTFKLEEEIDIKYDVFFIGREKGRLDYLNELETVMNSMGITTYFHIVNGNKLLEQKHEYKPLISYDKVLRLIGESRVILDIVQVGQSGQTLRSMEALFFSKKMITNNKSIIDCDFYCKENIFVLDVDDITRLKEFINTPFKLIEKNIIDKYEFSEWIKRFQDEE